MIGYAFCGSFCTHRVSLEILRVLLEKGLSILPIMSETVYTTDTRFGSAKALKEEVRRLTGRDIVHTLVEAEPLGPATPLDALVISGYYDDCIALFNMKLFHYNDTSDQSTSGARERILR